MLRAIGADVYVCRLPAMPVGRKVGVDDFFADGHTVDDLSGLIGPHIPSAHALQEPYREHDGRIERFVPPKQREEDGQFVAVTLNYTAQVVAEKVWDDGIDQNLVFTIEGALSDGRQLATVDVPAAQFQSWSWVTSRWGIRARLTVGMNAEKHAPAAVQYLSGDVPQRLVFGHTGWRHVNGRNVFLHADGAIGEDGLDESIETELDQFLKPFALPEPPQGSQLLGAVRASVGVLCAAPAHIVGPLWACVWRSVFGDAAFSVFLVGPTGTRKSSLAAVLVSHFGASLARKESLTQNWSSTANALEGAAFYAKDVILVIDDFVPSRGTSGDRQQMEKLASRILRSSGNQSGRSRMKADGRLHAVRPNRALIVSTGEELPDGASELRRALVLELSSGDIDLDGLTRCQVDGEEGMLTCCLAAFLQWAAPRLTDLRDRIRTAVRSSRDGTCLLYTSRCV